MTINLSPQLEIALSEEAAKRGTTPQLLAEQLIQSQLPEKPLLQAPPERPTLAERWQQHFASLPPPTTEERPAWLRSDNVREAVGKILEERQAQGRR